MINNEQLTTLTGATVVDNDGNKIGSMGQVYLDDATGTPEWITVNTGLFGTSESFVPISQASIEGGNTIRVPFDKSTVKGAPRVSDDGHLEESEEAELYSYYGLGDTYSTGYDRGTRDDAYGTTDVDRTDVDRTADVDRTTDVRRGSDDAMTRSEEELKVGTERRETGRARLRKYVVTEQESVTVPVRREEVRLEREPITDGNVGDATDGPAISEAEHDVVLHEEVPVVKTEARPVERVRLDTETVTEQEQVSGEVRKEQIELDTDERR